MTNVMTGGFLRDDATLALVMTGLAPAAPVNNVAPAITGSAYTGQTITCSHGSWSGNPRPTYTYQWQNAGSDLTGETASTYVLLVGDEGDNITCVVTATNTEGSASATSNTVVPTVAPPVNSVAPAITGVAETGRTLTCSSGTWSGSPTYAYQWKRDGSSIGGATSSTYLLGVADEGTAVKCTVTATNAGGTGTPADSNTVNPTVATTPDEIIPGYTAGRSWSLDFVDPDANFALSNMERGTDPVTSQPAVFLTAAGTLGTILTAATDLQHVQIVCQLRPAALGVFDISNINAQLLARFNDINNEWRGERKWATGTLQGWAVNAGTSDGATFKTGMDTADDTTLRWLKLEMVEDEIVRAKEWTGARDDEPDWADTDEGRIRGNSGIANTSTTDNDNPAETGAAGIRMRFGGYIQGTFEVTELLRVNPDNLLNNLGLAFMHADDQPFFWQRSSVLNDATNGLYAGDFEWSDGITRRSLRALKDNDTDQGPLWENEVYLDAASDNVWFTRDHPRPAITGSFPEAIRFRGYSQATNVADIGTLAAALVFYFWDGAGNPLMNVETANDYFVNLGPSGGKGTWGRTPFDITIPIDSNDIAVRGRLSIGLHDFTCTADELLLEITSVEVA